MFNANDESSSGSSGESSVTVESFDSDAQDGPTFTGAPVITPTSPVSDSDDDQPLKRPKH